MQSLSLRVQSDPAEVSGQESLIEFMNHFVNYYCSCNGKSKERGGQIERRRQGAAGASSLPTCGGAVIPKAG